jgi:hypothetical protein
VTLKEVMIYWGLLEEHWNQGGTGVPKGGPLGLDKFGARGKRDDNAFLDCHLQGEMWLGRCPEELRQGVRAYFLKLGGDGREWDEVYLAAGFRNGWELHDCVNKFFRWVKADMQGPGTKKGPS